MCTGKTLTVTDGHQGAATRQKLGAPCFRGTGCNAHARSCWCASTPTCSPPLGSLLQAHKAWAPTTQGCVTSTHSGPASSATSTSTSTLFIAQDALLRKLRLSEVQQRLGGTARGPCPGGRKARMPRSVGHQEAQTGLCAWTHFSSWTVWARQCRRRGRGCWCGSRGRPESLLTTHTFGARETPTPRKLPYALPAITSCFWNILVIPQASRVGVTVIPLSMPGSGAHRNHGEPELERASKTTQPTHCPAPGENSETGDYPMGALGAEAMHPRSGVGSSSVLQEAGGWVRFCRAALETPPPVRVSSPAPSSLFPGSQESPSVHASIWSGGRMQAARSRCGSRAQFLPKRMAGVAGTS